VYLASTLETSKPVPLPSVRAPAAVLAVLALSTACLDSGSRPTAARTDQPVQLILPSGAGGIGFDDLRFSAGLGAVLVPSGRSGALNMVEPDSLRVAAIAGFTSRPTWSGGHDEGVTSADAYGPMVLATDRDSKLLSLVDPGSGRITASVRLAAKPDFVRAIVARGDVWVTEPDAEQIEVLHFARPGAPPTHLGTIRVEDCPEALAVDTVRNLAYTNLEEKGATLAISLDSHRIVARWPNGCRISQGLALDDINALLFVVCGEGRIAVLSLTRNGAVIDTGSVGSGVDMVDFDPSLRHLYAPAPGDSSFTTLGVSAAGRLTRLGSIVLPGAADCVASAGRGRVFVCAPRDGALWVVRDTLPASAP
jgi:DNA-binding beta-propeller fold protein YncE